MKSQLITTLAACCLLAGSVYADGGRHKHFKHHDDSVVSRNVDEVKTANGFERTMTKTNDKGQTATRNIKVVNDPATATRTETVTGTNYNGEQYSNQTISRKTENGFTRDSRFTNSKGETTHKLVDATVDKEARKITKRISTTSPKGETSEKVVVRDLSKRKH